MFAELFFFCLTVVGLVLLDKVSAIIGVTALGVLTYLCTAKCIREGADKSVSRCVRYYDQYLQGIGSVSHRLIFSWRWYYFYKHIKAIIYLVRAARRVDDESGSNENVALANSAASSRRVPDHCGSDLSVDDEIKTIVDCVLKEYIKSWYCGKISQNKDFVNDVDCVIKDTLLAFCGGIAKADRKQFMCHVLQVYLHYFFHFKQALNKIIADKTVLEICLMRKKEILQNFEMHHWAMKDQITEWSYLQSIMGTLIDSFGPVELLCCPLLHTVVVEILTQNVMYPLVNILTDPDRLNSWLAKLLQNVLRIENEKLFINGIAVENNMRDSATPSIFISDEATAATGKSQILLPQNCLHTEAQTISNTNFFSNSSFSDLDNSSNISCEIGDISFDKLSAISSESSDISKLTPDKVHSLPHVLYERKKDDNEEEEEDEAKINYLVFSPMNGRARSNSHVSNNPDNLSVQSDHRESSKCLEVTQMKRSKSADFIRHMPETSNLLPLNILNHSIRYCGKTNKNFLQLKPEVLSVGDIEIAEEAIEKEVPPLFSDVKIINTQQQEDSGHNPYTLYCIQYNGVFQNMSSGSHFPELVQQVVSIKRRFREFLALQSRLEDNPLVKSHLKGIKGPSKWLATPFANLDKKNVAERKVFLESYLQALCKRDPIAKSTELQEFLAYGGDASIAYVKKPSDINVPRIDKFIVRGVKGAIDLFRTALPSTSESGVIKESNICVPDVPVDESNSEPKFQVYVADYSKKGPEILKHIRSFFKHFESSSSTESLYDDCIPFDTVKGSLRRGSLLQHSLSINDSDGCTCYETVPFAATLHEDSILAHLIVDLIAESLPEKSFISHLLKFLPISFMQSFLEQKLHEISEEKCARLLHMFHMSLWPEVKPTQKSQWNPNMVNVLHEVLNEQFEALLSTKYFGEILNKPLGSNTSYAVEMLLGSIQHRQLNRCLLFYVFDVIIQILCAKEQ